MIMESTQSGSQPNKIKLRDSLSPIILMTVGVIVTFGIVSFGFRTINIQKQTGAEYASQINEVNIRMEEDELAKYDGAVVTGAEVINVVKRYADKDISFKVGNEDVSAVNIKEKVSLGSSYTGVVARENGAVTAITFTEQS